MKTLLITMVALVVMSVATGQQSSSDKLYANLDGAKGVTIVSLSKDIINIVDMVVDEDSKNVTGPLEKVKMMICQQEAKPSSREALIKTLSSRPFKKVEDDDNDEDSDIFIIRSGRKIKECHILHQGNNRLFLLSFYGDFRVSDIDKMANKAENMR